MSYKIQEYDQNLGWVFTTRAGPTLADAKRMLKGYWRDYPRARYRLVELTSGEPIVVVAERLRVIP
jgi:hypothetical protein